MTNPFKQDENMERCRLARRALERRHKTFDGLCDFLFQLEQQPLPAPQRPAAVIRPSAQPFSQGEAVEHCRQIHEKRDRRVGTRKSERKDLKALRKAKAEPEYRKRRPYEAVAKKLGLMK